MSHILTNLEALASKLEGARLDLEQASRSAAVAVMEALDQVGLGDVVRWHVLSNARLPPERQLESHEAEEPKRRRKKKAATKHGGSRPAPKDTNRTWEGKRKLLAPVLAAAAQGESTWQMLVELSRKPIALPDRETRKYTPESLRGWMKKLQGEAQTKKQTRTRAKTPRVKSATEMPLEDRGPSKKKVDNPRPLARVFIASAHDHQNRDCRAFARCAIIARRNQWSAFGCDECEGPGKKK